jgi:hypothetical protein
MCILYAQYLIFFLKKNYYQYSIPKEMFNVGRSLVSGTAPTLIQNKLKVHGNP